MYDLQEQHAGAEERLQLQLEAQRREAETLSERLAEAEADRGLPEAVQASRGQLADARAALAAAQRQHAALRRWLSRSCLTGPTSNRTTCPTLGSGPLPRPDFTALRLTRGTADGPIDWRLPTFDASQTFCPDNRRPAGGFDSGLLMSGASPGLMHRAAQGPLRSGLAGDEAATPPGAACARSSADQQELVSQLRALQAARERERAEAATRLRCIHMPSHPVQDAGGCGLLNLFTCALVASR